MKLWLVCFMALFDLAEGYRWVSQLHWIGEIHLSLPVIIAGGTVLAIASNAAHLSGPPMIQNDRDRPIPPAPGGSQASPKAPSFEIKPPQPVAKSISFKVSKSRPDKPDAQLP